MTIHLTSELENRIQEAVRSGRFSSVDEAMTEAAHLLIRELDRMPVPPSGDDTRLAVESSIGAMLDAADEMDEIVTDAYRRRRLGC